MSINKDKYSIRCRRTKMSNFDRLA